MFVCFLSLFVSIQFPDACALHSARLIQIQITVLHSRCTMFRLIPLISTLELQSTVNLP